MRLVVVFLGLTLAACHVGADVGLEDSGGLADLRVPDLGGSADLGGAADLARAPDLLPARQLTPVAPTATSFGWQGVQREFKRADGSRCSGAVTIAMGDQAVCFVAADDSLRCAGRVYMKTFGSRFVSTDQMQVDQVLLSPTFNMAGGNQMCIHKTDGAVLCMGYGNVVKAADFGPWGSKTDWSAIATGTFDRLCGIDRAGQVYCSGFGLGDTPVVQDGGRTHTSFWPDTAGMLHFDDPSVFRISAGRAECQVGTMGLRCGRNNFGLIGEVVDGSQAQSRAVAIERDVCILTEEGKVHCWRADLSGIARVETVFLDGTVLALAANMYTDSLCAVYADGSLHCMGSNKEGKLGTGDTTPLVTATEVQPPGMVRIGCR